MSIGRLRGSERMNIGPHQANLTNVSEHHFSSSRTGGLGEG